VSFILVHFSLPLVISYWTGRVAGQFGSKQISFKISISTRQDVTWRLSFCPLLLASRIFGTIEATATRKETVYVPFKNKAQSNLIYFCARFVFILVVLAAR